MVVGGRVEWGTKLMGTNGYEVSFQGDKILSKLIVVIVLQLCEYTNQEEHEVVPTEVRRPGQAESSPLRVQYQN